MKLSSLVYLMVIIFEQIRLFVRLFQQFQQNGTSKDGSFRVKTGPGSKNHGNLSKSNFDASKPGKFRLRFGKLNFDRRSRRSRNPTLGWRANTQICNYMCLAWSHPPQHFAGRWIQINNLIIILFLCFRPVLVQIRP